MNLETLLEDVDPQWRKAFIQFVQTGEAPPEFLQYLDHDARGQSAVERAFTAQAEALEELAQVIKRSDRTKLRAARAPVERPSSAIRRAVERVIGLPRKERHEALADAAAALTHDVSAEGVRQVRSTISELEHEIATRAQ